MKRKGIQRCRMERQRNAPAQQARRVNQFRWGGHKRRHVDRLANVAGGFRTPFVLVDKRGARGEVHQRQACNYNQRALPKRTGHGIPYPQTGQRLA